MNRFANKTVIATGAAAGGGRVIAQCPEPIEGDRIEDMMAHHAAVEKTPIEKLRHAWAMDAPMQRFARRQEVANAMLFLCSDEASAATGQALNVTCGFLMT